MVIFYKKWKKYNEIQLTKNKMDLNIQKMINHPPSPVNIIIKVVLNMLALQKIQGKKYNIIRLKNIEQAKYEEYSDSSISEELGVPYR